MRTKFWPRPRGQLVLEDLTSLLLASKSEVKTFRKYVHGNDIALQTPGQPPSDQQHPAAPGAQHTEDCSMAVNTAG